MCGILNIQERVDKSPENHRQHEPEAEHINLNGKFIFSGHLSTDIFILKHSFSTSYIVRLTLKRTHSQINIKRLGYGLPKELLTSE